MTAAAAGVVAILIGVLAGVRLLNASSSPEAAVRPVEITTSNEARTWVSGGALTRSLTLDAGALRLDPPSGPAPKGGVGERRALELWRAGAGGFRAQVSDVVIARAQITVNLALQPSYPVMTARPPAFSHRTGWLVLSTNPGPYSCPARTPAPPAVGADVLPVWLLSADGNDAIDYTSAGTGPCGTTVTTPRAQTGAVTATAVAGEPDPETAACSIVSSTSSGSTGSTTLITTVLGPRPCTGGALDPALRPGPLATGLVTGDPGDGLDYYDGHERHLP